MLSWMVILYGAVLSAVAAAALNFLAAQAPKAPVAAGAAVAGFLGPLAWNAILVFTAANQFFVDAPIAVFPVSWQDTGSGVFALAAGALVLGFGPMAGRTGRDLALGALLTGVAALVVDVFLY